MILALMKVDLIHLLDRVNGVSNALDRREKFQAITERSKLEVVEVWSCFGFLAPAATRTFILGHNSWYRDKRFFDGGGKALIKS